MRYAGLIIHGNTLEELRISPKELMIDLAVYLYDKDKLSIGQTKKISRIDSN